MKHISAYLEKAFREMFEERAAIHEFDGGQSREEAEKHAEIEARTKAAEIHRAEMAGQA